MKAHGPHDNIPMRGHREEQGNVAISYRYLCGRLHEIATLSAQ